ncbi:MAG: DoxX family protein [Nanoarchaeota archaeon]
MLSKIGERYKEQLYFVFRVFVGLLFFQHGAQKLFGLFGGSQQALFSLMGLAGSIELIGGLFITFGLLTRLSAFLGACVMIGAWVIVHIPQGLIPIENKGELAALFFAVFLVLIAYGSGKWSIDRVFKKK